MTKERKLCAFPGCQEAGEFPAPSSPDKLWQRIYFCLEHVKEYNRKWNGLSGFTGDEIFTMQQGAYWNRPTWKMGTGAGQGATAENTHDPFSFFGTPPHIKEATQHNKHSLQNVPGQIRQACYTLGVNNPIDVPETKKAYRALVKKHHPDIDNSEENIQRIQKINEAYRTLLLYAKRNKVS